MIYLIIAVINNTHMPAGVFTTLADAQAAFSASCTTTTHYIAAYPSNILVGADTMEKIQGRIVIENLAKREDDSHAYTSWYVPEGTSDGVVENPV